MMKGNRIFKQQSLLPFILFIYFFTSTVDAADYSFTRISVDAGLSQVSVRSIHQDNLNRVWLGTRDGLNCYDGNSMRIFRSIKGDPGTLLSNDVVQISQCSHYLWILSYQGVSRLDLANMKIKRYRLGITSSMCILDSTLYVALQNEVMVYDHTNDIFTSIHELQNAFTGKNILYNNDDKELWIGTKEKGLLIYDVKTKKTINRFVGKVNNITKIFKDKHHNIWIGTDLDGVFYINSNFEIREHFRKQAQKNSLVSDIVRDIVQDNNNNIWIGTFQGISVYSPLNKTFTSIQHIEKNPHSLSHNSVYCFLKDKDGGFWIGTYFGGVNYTNIDNQIFKHYHNDAPNKHPNFHVIGHFLEDDKNNIYIATEGGGLNYYNTKTKRFTYFPASDKPYSLNQSNVRALYQYDKNTLLIGTHLGGINILDIPSGRITNFQKDIDNKKEIPTILGDIQKVRGEIVVAAHSGVYKFDVKNRRFSRYFEDESIHNAIGEKVLCFKEDSKGNLWLGTEMNGLFKYSPFTKKLTHYLSSDNDSTTIGSNSIGKIFEDHLFRIWIGTMGGGLSLYLPEEDKFTTFTQSKDNLPSNFIFGIVESRYGNLWISTRHGLSRFDVVRNQFLNYNRDSGFPLSELNYGSLMLSKDGNLYVGSIDGFISFREEQIIKPQMQSNIIFSSLLVNNKKVSANDVTEILDKDISVTNFFRLKPKYKVFTIYYANCNYNSLYRHKYEYKLEGFDNDWVDVGFRSYASYTNISPGTYTFQVRAKDAIYSNVLATNSIEIKIDPPFFVSLPAFIIYIILLVGIIIAVRGFYIKQIKLSYKLNQEHEEKLYQDKLHKNKLLFFTNISHEFQTPLTLIIGSLEHIRKSYQVSGKVHKRLDTAYRHAMRLKRLTAELLQFRKIDQGFYKIKVRELNMVEYLDIIYASFSEIAKSRKVSYNLVKKDDFISIWCDPYQMDKVFYNLLSNAFKFVKDGLGKIEVQINNNADHLEILIIDNGKGIARDELDQVFNRFYQSTTEPTNKSIMGSGIGLALTKGIIEAHQGSIHIDSEVGKGTQISVILKKGNSHFTEEQIIAQTDADQHMLSYEVEENKALRTDNIVPAVPDENAPTLLVIDDNEEILELIKDIFGETYFVVAALNGEEGFETALEQQPDLIISDVMMPGISGTELCMKLKRNFHTSHIPIILLTARTAVEHKIEGIETGADDYVTKPFSTDYLIARVNSLLKNREVLQQKFSKEINIEHKQIAKNKIDQKFIEKATEIIEQHITDPDFSVIDFATRMGQSRTLFYRKIKGITGQTPNEFIQSTRLKKSAEMLLSDATKNISEIAYDVGFSSPRYFSQCFKNHFGVIPSKYVKLDNEEV